MKFWDLFLYVLFASAVTVGTIHGATTYVALNDVDGIHIDDVRQVSWRQ